MTGEEPRMPQDEEIRHAWRAASAESPPSHVDAAILAAARDAARRPGAADGAQRVRPRHREWQPMLAAAAIAGLAFALVQTIPREARDALPSDRAAPAVVHPESSELATTQQRAAPADSVGQPARQDAGSAPPAQVPPAMAERPSRHDEYPSPPVQAPVVAESTAESAPFQTEADSSGAARSTARVAQPIVTPAPASESAPVVATAPAPAPQTTGKLMSALPQAVAKGERSSATVDDKEAGAGLQVGMEKSAVDARIEHIVELYQSGDRTGAAAELRALRIDAEGVDARLPPNLQAWARTVH